MSEQYYSLYELSFHFNKYQDAQNYILKAFSLKHPIFPWDLANIAEGSFRSQKYKEGIDFLSKAIDDLKKNKCPLENHWTEILQKITSSPDGDYIQQLQSNDDPWFFKLFPDSNAQVHYRKAARYPRLAARQKFVGYIQLSAIINTKGKVICTFLSEGAGNEFLKPTKKALERFKYYPASHNGSPVVAYGMQTNFMYQMGRRR